MKDYREFGQLSVFHLEESYILDIVARPGSLACDVDLALFPEHREYTSPAPGERHCYKRGWMRFSSVSELHWVDQGWPPAVDASGESDYGTIDSMKIDGDRYVMAGDFGEIRVIAQAVVIQLRDLGVAEPVD